MKRLQLRIPCTKDEKRRMVRCARRQKKSVSAVVNDALTNFIARCKGKRVTISLWLDPAIELLGRHHARQQGISFSAYVEGLLQRDKRLLAFEEKGSK